MHCGQVIVDGIEFQPCVASGNKKTARAEAAMVCLQELAALPADHTAPQAAPPHPHSVPPVVVPTGAPRPAICPPPRPPRPPRPLMSLQPRPQFASLSSHRQPNPTVLSTEPLPPGVDASDFTSNVFDDNLRQFGSTPMPVSADRPHEPNEPFQAEGAECGTTGVEGSKEQFEEDSLVTSGSVGLLGEAPEGLEADHDEYFDDGDDSGCSAVEFNEFPHNFRPTWLEQQPARNMRGFFGENPENIRPEFSDQPTHIRNMPGIHPEFSYQPPNTAFGRPRFHPPEFEDFSEDTLTNEGPGILGEYYEGCDELFSDLCEEFAPLEEDFQSDICLQNLIGFGRGSMLRAPRPFSARGPRMSQISGLAPRVPRQFSRGPAQQFPCPSFNIPSSLLPTPSSLLPTPLPQGAFRPRVRPFVRPFSRPH